MSAKPRVLLVEDDPAMRRFVAMAVQHLDIELIGHATVGDALAELAAAPVNLIMTDLMLPDQSGLDFLAALRAKPALRGHARIVVASAAIDATTQSQLRELGAWRQLAKPLSLDDIESCVIDGLDHLEPLEAAAGASTAAVGAAAASSAVAEYFGGDDQLYLDFRATCLPQFAVDVAEGDACLAAGNKDLLKRIAHSLKTVLQTLGEPGAEAIARRLDAGLMAGDWQAAQTEWPLLRTELLRLCSQA